MARRPNHALQRTASAPYVRCFSFPCFFYLRSTCFFEAGAELDPLGRLRIMHSEFVKASDLFRRELCSWKSKAGDLVPLPCRIHDVFSGLHSESHNCIGCNFAGTINAIERVLSRIASGEAFDNEFDYGDYLFSMYLFVERAHMLFDIICLPEPYRHRHFGVFQEIKRWANFLKHPNYFILVHHPVFQAGGAAVAVDWEQVVDTQFVVENYGHDAQSKSSKLKAAFVKKTKVLVLFPDVIPLTKRFCDAVKHFVSLIEDNAVFREMLNDIATYENYFDTLPKSSA